MSCWRDESSNVNATVPGCHGGKPGRQRPHPYRAESIVEGRRSLATSAWSNQPTSRSGASRLRFLAFVTRTVLASGRQREAR
jgi:hypothetical protein